MTYLSQKTNAIHIYLYHGVMRIGKKEFGISPGDVSISPAGVESSYDLPEPGFHYCAHFVTDDNGGGLVAEAPTFSKGENDSALLTGIFTQAMRFHEAAEGKKLPEAEFGAASAIRQILLHLALLPRLKNPAGRMDRIFASLENLLESRLSNPPAIGEISTILGISGNYLARIFKKRHGMRIRQFMEARRIERAKYLLEHTSLPVKTIGAMTGYNDPQHFNKKFRAGAGTSPSAHRAKFGNGA